MITLAIILTALFMVVTVALLERHFEGQVGEVTHWYAVRLTIVVIVTLSITLLFGQR